MPTLERYFNTTGGGSSGPLLYSAARAFDLDEVLRLIRNRRYFVLHAPRQTGKTSALLSLRDLLNQSDDCRCVYTNVEAGQAARDDVEQRCAPS